MSSSPSNSASPLPRKKKGPCNATNTTNKEMLNHPNEIITMKKSKQLSSQKFSTDIITSDSTLLCPPYNLFPPQTADINYNNNNIDNTNIETKKEMGNKNFDDGLASIVKILEKRKNIVVLVGAGISVSCGIPDFRSKGTGIYHNMDANELGLSTPEELFHLECFQDDPRPFYKFATKMLYPIKPIEPSPSHRFLSLLERKKLLLRVYTQNIDGLEEKAGVSSKKVVYAHGSLKTSTCLKCGHKVSCEEVREEILNGQIPLCKRVLNKNRKRKRNNETDTQVFEGGYVIDGESSLSITTKPRKARSSSSNNVSDGDRINFRTCNGNMKPSITFFGEQLVDRVRKCLEADRKKADAVIVIGTSLSVAPMSKIIEYLSPSIPRILINRAIVIPKHGTYCEDVNEKNNADDEEEEYATTQQVNSKNHRDNYVFDACLLGFCDEVTKSLIALMAGTMDDKVSHARKMSSGSNDFEILCNLPALRGSLNDAKLFRHPDDRIFVYPGAILDSIDSESNENGEDGSTEMKFQEIVHCDGCHKVIKTTIMKCTDCFDFDLCQECYHAVSKIHFNGYHKFIAESWSAPNQNN